MSRASAHVRAGPGGVLCVVLFDAQGVGTYGGQSKLCRTARFIHVTVCVFARACVYVLIMVCSQHAAALRIQRRWRVKQGTLAVQLKAQAQKV